MSGKLVSICPRPFWTTL